MIRLRCSNSDFLKWKQESELDGFRNLSEWIRKRLNAVDPVATQVLAAPNQAINPVRGAAVATVAAEGVATVTHITFVRPAIWTAHLDNGKSWPVSKKPDPKAPMWAKADLMAWCSNENAIGFNEAWKVFESEMKDGGFLE